MKPNIVLYRKIPDDLFARLQEQCQVTFFDGINADNRAAFIKALAEAEGVIGTGVKFTDELMAAAPKLKAASTITVGYDDFDVAKLSERGVALMHTPGVLTETTADMGFALLMAAARRVTEGERFLRDGKWNRWAYDMLIGQDVHGATLGIIGMGRIGQAIARRGALGFGMKVLSFERTARAFRTRRERRLPSLLPWLWRRAWVMRSRAGGSGMAEAISTGIWPPTAISVHWRLELPLMSFGCPKRSSSHLTSRLMQL